MGNSFQWIENKLYWIALPASGIHEAAHFGVAKLLGLEAHFGWYVTRFKPKDRWRTALVLLAPAMLGALTLLLVIVIATTQDWRISLAMWFLTGLVFIFWELGCLADFVSVIHLATQGHAINYAADINTRGFISAQRVWEKETKR